MPKSSFVFSSVLRCAFAIGLSVLLSSDVLRAQQESYRQYGENVNLSSSDVNCLVQDSRGYLWIGTVVGLNRFDGRTMEPFFKREAFLNDEIFALEEDSKGRIWAGTIGGLTCLDGNMVSTIPLPDSLAEEQVRALESGPNGELWIGLSGRGMLHFDGQKFTKLYGLKDGLPSGRVRTIFREENGRLWIGTKRGLSTLVDGSLQRVQFEQEGPRSISQIIGEREGVIWIGTFSQGLFRYDGQQLDHYTREDGLVSDWVRSLCLDFRGHIWCATKQGASVFDGESFRSIQLDDGIPAENLDVVYEDQEYNIWFGSRAAGLIWQSNPAFVTFNGHGHLRRSGVMSIVEDRDRNLWFSTFDRGITRLQGKTYEDFTNQNALNNNSMWGSLMDHDGNLWFGTSDGVTRYDGQNFDTYSLREGLPGKYVYAIHEDRNNQLYFGTNKGFSILRNGAPFQNFSATGDLALGKVRAFAEDQNGTLFLATVNGLFSFDGQDLRHWGAKEGFIDDAVMCLERDWQGHLWIGTDQGIFRYANGRFDQIPIDYLRSGQQLTNFLIFDLGNMLWIGTQSGILRLDVPAWIRDQSVLTTEFGLLDGLPSMETNQNAAFADSQGKLWFGTARGLVQVDPSNVSKPFNPDFPKIELASILLSLKDKDWSKESDSLDSRSGLPINLKVNYDQRYLTFRVKGISLSDPGAVRYVWKLDGFDNDWVPMQEVNIASYPNLPYGNYTFLAKAIDKQGRDSPEPIAFSFTVRPPFYLTSWFITLSVILFALLVFGIIRWRVQVARRKREREQLVFQSKMLGLEQQTLNTSMNRHFIFNALNSIQYYINRQDKLAANLYLANFAKLVRKNLDSTQTNLVSLSEELERLELYLSLEHMRFSDKFSYDIDVDDDVDREEIKIPSMLLQPFVENSIRHGILPMDREGRILVRISCREELVVFTIEDNGIGINTSMALKGMNGQDHVSMGMEITEERINLLRKMTDKQFYIKGPFELQNDKGETRGTRVEIILPMEHNFYLN